MDNVENVSVNEDGVRLSPGTTLSSPQRLPPDRVLAARASAAALAASAVRVGYVAAALARAGGHTGYPRHSSTQLGIGRSSGSREGLPNHIAAVRAAAAHASVGSEESSNCNTSSPRKRLEFSIEAKAPVEDDSADNSRRSPVRSAATESTESLAETTISTSSVSHRYVTSIVAEEEELCSPKSDCLAHESCSSACKGSEDAVESLSRAECQEQEVSTNCTDVDEGSTNMVLHEASTEDASVEDPVSEGEWDIVVQRTFISVVRRRQVLPHTVSAPGCIGIGGVSIGASGRQRRARSHRRSRRRRVSVGQTTTSNSAELH